MDNELRSVVLVGRLVEVSASCGKHPAHLLTRTHTWHSSRSSASLRFLKISPHCVLCPGRLWRSGSSDGVRLLDDDSQPLLGNVHLDIPGRHSHHVTHPLECGVLRIHRQNHRPQSVHGAPPAAAGDSPTQSIFASKAKTSPLAVQRPVT